MPFDELRANGIHRNVFGSKYVIIFMVLWSGTVGIGFVWMGAWLVVPFMGLELLALTTALYYVCWKLSHQEVIRIDKHEVLLEKGIRWPKQSWRWPRNKLKLRIETPQYPWQTPTILFTGNNRDDVRVGEFLNLEDCEELIKRLTIAGLVARKYTQAQFIRF